VFGPATGYSLWLFSKTRNYSWFLSRLLMLAGLLLWSSSLLSDALMAVVGLCLCEDAVGDELQYRGSCRPFSETLYPVLGLKLWLKGNRDATVQPHLAVSCPHVLAPFRSKY
jgi:hypothetical protein